MLDSLDNAEFRLKSTRHLAYSYIVRPTTERVVFKNRIAGGELLAMVFHYLPFAVVALAGFSRDRSAASFANPASRIPCLVSRASQLPNATLSVALFSRRVRVPAFGSFTHRSNAHDSWGTRTGRKGGDRIDAASDRRVPAGGERGEVGQGGGTHG